MKIAFQKITDFERGILHRLLVEGYSFDDRWRQCYEQDWIEFDHFFFDNPEIADHYGFITTLDGKPIGHISWDPRNLPEYVEVGHNCITPEWKGHGYGQKQLREAVRRIREYDVKKIKVFTNEKLLPAQHNYEKAGFVLKGKRENTTDSFSGCYYDYEIIVR